MLEPLCLKTNQTESELDKATFEKGVDHLGDAMDDITIYYSKIGENKAYKQGVDRHLRNGFIGHIPCDYFLMKNDH